jgi:hypothetical protein
MGHGVVLARKRDAALSTRDLERPDPNDPRELAAQRLQIMLLEENAARLGGQMRRQRDRIAKLSLDLQRLRGKSGQDA